MKRLLACLLLLASSAALASEGHGLMYHAEYDLHDKASLQRGARLFVNYCMGCHGASMMRYSHVARDLGIPEKVAVKNLNFTGQKVGDPMITAMRPEDGKAWFGAPPPDLTVVARARGADWLASYLRTFYLDPKRPTGVNNLTFPDVAMPHVLWELQGWQRAVYAEDGKTIEGLELARPGKLDEAEYAAAVNDLVGFLVYLGEPVRLERLALGWKVILFLLLFSWLAWLLKKEYWRDVH
ncbi:MAG: cytochrome c1 [Gammaproteobacteria bacterium]|nr:MAG: cytochrome c1 [Gammaproteobacteria bacterium]